MLKKVLWLAVACAVLLAGLALSVRMRPAEKKPEPPGPVAVEVVRPAAPEPKVVEAPPQPTPEELQMQEDAAAVGMTNVDPAPESPETESAERPTN